MKRHAFLKKISLGAALIVALTAFTGCDNGDSSNNNGGNNSGQSAPTPTPTPTPTTPGQGKACLNGAQTTVMPGGNPSHTHGSTQVSATDVATGTTQTYQVPPENGHSHTFTLQPTHFAILRSSGAVSVSTNPDGTSHFHTVTVTCK